MNRFTQPHPVCPHCGRDDHDEWEWDFGPSLEGERIGQCGSCGEEFVTERFVSVYYTTSKGPQREN